MKPFDPYLSAAQLDVTLTERIGLIAFARMLPTIPHKPRPADPRREAPLPLVAFDMSHIHSGDAGCGEGWMRWLGYIPHHTDFSPSLTPLFYPNLFQTKIQHYADITPMVMATAIYHFLETADAYKAFP